MRDIKFLKTIPLDLETIRCYYQTLEEIAWLLRPEKPNK